MHKRKVGKPIIHWLSALVVFFVASGFGFINTLFTNYAWWQFAFYSMAIHLALFDPIWNFLHKESWYYSGTSSNPSRAWMDKFWSVTPPLAQPLFRFIFFYLGYAVYYRWNEIVG
jgi:hypothetical protein